MLLTLGAACTAAPAPATGDLTVWRPLGTWSGNGLLQTEPFIGNSGLLRVTWDARTPTASGTGTLRVILHSDVSGRALTPVVEQEGSGHGVKYITEDPRSFFLVIEAHSLEWTVDVAEGVAATRRKPR